MEKKRKKKTPKTNTFIKALLIKKIQNTFSKTEQKSNIFLILFISKTQNMLKRRKKHGPFLILLIESASP